MYADFSNLRCSHVPQQSGIDGQRGQAPVRFANRVGGTTRGNLPGFDIALGTEPQFDPGPIATPVGVCKTMAGWWLLSNPNVHCNTTWFDACATTCMFAAHSRRGEGSANSLQVTIQLSKRKISVRCGTGAGGGAGAEAGCCGAGL